MAIYHTDHSITSGFKTTSITATYKELEIILGAPSHVSRDNVRTNIEFRAYLGNDRIAVWDWNGPDNVQENTYWSLWADCSESITRFCQTLGNLRLYGTPPESITFDLDGVKFTFNGTRAELIAELANIGVEEV